MRFPLCLLALTFTCSADPLPGTQPLQEEGDLAAKMVQGIHRFLDRETVEVTKARAALWKPDTSSPEAWEKSMEPKRARLRQLLGIPSNPETSLPRTPRKVSQKDPFGDVRGLSEGLSFEPDGWGAVIVIPDCGVTPEQMFAYSPGVPAERQWAERLGSAGKIKVLAMSLIDRRDGALLPEGRKSKYSQREVLWRAGFEMGRSLLGHEVQEVLNSVDAYREAQPDVKIGLLGSGEGGLIALLAAALDSRITSVAVEGVFGPSDAQWEWPIDRTVFGLQREFGMAELAAMISGSVCVRSSAWPEVRLTDAGGGAPGRIAAPTAAEIAREIQRLEILSAGIKKPVVEVTPDQFLYRLVDGMAGGLPEDRSKELLASLSVVEEPAYLLPTDPAEEAARQARLFSRKLEDTQHLMRQAQKARGEYWKGADFSSAEKFAESAKAYREKFWTDVVGKLPPATLPPNARSRQIYDTEKFTGWEVMLDVYPDVFSFGTLLLPKDIKPDEKRAVVVCQHGLEGRPSDLADPKLDHPAYHTYGARLAEKGYIVFAPQNPYIGKTEFRQICRKAWPLGLSLWSFIVRQHEVILTWLKTQPQVDASRIAFYGLSYGGKTAMRIPALLPDYCLSICSADYNEWIWKNVDASAPYSYLHTNEYDMVEWNMGNTFNYAELSWLIFPRPFMVERGHDDGVSCDEWVAYEFARTRRHYSKLGLGDRAEIEFFNGPHTINGQGTFRFLDKWLAK
jgi:dienelactone hydrolase